MGGVIAQAVLHHVGVKVRNVRAAPDLDRTLNQAAFCWRGDDSEEERRFITGVNFSVAIGNPFRELGSMGESLDSILTEQRAGRYEPIIYLLHLAHPRVRYTDRGKTAVALGR